MPAFEGSSWRDMIVPASLRGPYAGGHGPAVHYKPNETTMIEPQAIDLYPMEGPVPDKDETVAMNSRAVLQGPAFKPHGIMAPHRKD